MPYADIKQKTEYSRLYRLNHKERISELGRKRYLENRSALLKYANEYDKLHRSEVYARHRKYRAIRGNEIRKYFRDWYLKNKERVILYREKYVLTHKEHRRIASHNRRALSVVAGKLTLEIVQRVYEYNIKKYGRIWKITS